MDEALPDLASQPNDVRQMCEDRSAAEGKSISDVWGEVLGMSLAVMQRKRCSLSSVWARSRMAMTAVYECKSLYEGLEWIHNSR